MGIHLELTRTPSRTNNQRSRDFTLGDLKLARFHDLLSAIAVVIIEIGRIVVYGTTDSICGFLIPESGCHPPSMNHTRG